MGVFEQKFKVGDRVRWTRVPTQFQNASIAAMDRGPWGIKIEQDGEYTYAYDTELELIEQPWQPKVGDRVRFTDKCLEFWWFGPHTKKKEGVIAGPSSWPGARGDFQFDVIVDGGSDVAYVSAEHIEPLPVAAEAQPAALTIEAGKFYRTRDGRKVGPMEKRAYDGEYPWESEFNNTTDDPHVLIFEDGGKNYELQHLDLIAEWVDEPAVPSDTVAVAATASNDNEAPKFKVGDRVNYTLSRDAWQGLVIKEVTTNGAGRTVYWADDSGCGEGAFYDHQLELITEPTAIVALIEGGQPKPSSRPYIHATEESASKEAERLALAHPGKEFGVYVLAGSKIADVVTETVTRTVLRAA